MNRKSSSPRWIPISQGLIWLFVWLLIYSFLGFNLITFLLGLIPLGLGLRSLKTGFFGSDRLINKMVSPEPLSDAARKEYHRIHGFEPKLQVSSKSLIPSKYLKKIKDAGSVEATFEAILHAMARLIAKDPSLMEKDEKLASKLIDSRWSIKKYKEDIIKESYENGKISFKKLYFTMLSYEYDPPLTFKLNDEQSYSLYKKISNLVDSGF